uniref:Leo1-like protein n=1 Tax=Angiostrongylus cantonensis TaxID=6313 RepID=A0A0K0DLW4_ANGCA
SEAPCNTHGSHPRAPCPPRPPSSRGRQIDTRTVWEYSNSGSMHQWTTTNHWKGQILKFKAENTIRWRFAQDGSGNVVKESNAKIVRWSDGSMSMVIGKEVFDVESVPIHGNMQHLFVRQGTGLVAQKIFDRKLIFRPHSTDSETHRKVTMNMAERTRKSGQVRMVAEVGSNPEQARREAVRREEEALRAAIRKETQQRRTKDRHRPLPNYLEGRTEYSGYLLSSFYINLEIIYCFFFQEFRKKKQQQKKKIVTSDEESN